MRSITSTERQVRHANGGVAWVHHVWLVVKYLHYQSEGDRAIIGFRGVKADADVAAAPSIGQRWWRTTDGRVVHSDDIDTLVTSEAYGYE